MRDPEVALRRQLNAFAVFSTHALEQVDVATLMSEACLRARAGLDLSHAKLLEYIPQRDRLLLSAGVGWQEGYVGCYEVSTSIDTPIGHAFSLSEAVAVSDYTNEPLYVYPSILKAHNCVASCNVPVRANGKPWGVLEVDNVQARSFSADDIAFLTGMGNAIGSAIELHRLLDKTKALVEDKAMMLREMNHRTKNNLMLVSSLLRIRARVIADAEIKTEMESAALRIANLALVHDRLQLFATSTDRVPAFDHFRELASMLQSLLPAGVAIEVACSGSINGNNVEALTLIANELVTNAAKYAFVDRATGRITIGFSEEGPGWRLWVKDDGQGLMPDLFSKSASFGHQLVHMLAGRIDAQVSVRNDGGTVVEIIAGAARS